VAAKPCAPATRSSCALPLMRDPVRLEVAPSRRLRSTCGHVFFGRIFEAFHNTTCSSRLHSDTTEHNSAATVAHRDSSGDCYPLRNLAAAARGSLPAARPSPSARSSQSATLGLGDAPRMLLLPLAGALPSLRPPSDLPASTTAPIRAARAARDCALPAPRPTCHVATDFVADHSEPMAELRNDSGRDAVMTEPPVTGSSAASRASRAAAAAPPEGGGGGGGGGGGCGARRAEDPTP
jgi:hypothetical protein